MFRATGLIVEARATSNGITFNNVCREQHIYLIAEWDTDEGMDAVLQEVCEEIFENNRTAVYRVPSSWPQDRSYESLVAVRTSGQRALRCRSTDGRGCSTSWYSASGSSASRCCLIFVMNLSSGSETAISIEAKYSHSLWRSSFGEPQGKQASWQNVQNPHFNIHPLKSGTAMTRSSALLQFR